MVDRKTDYVRSKNREWGTFPGHQREGGTGKASEKLQATPEGEYTPCEKKSRVTSAPGCEGRTFGRRRGKQKTGT